VTRIVAIGEEIQLAGYALAGAEVVATTDAERVRQAWAGVRDVGLVLLTPAARLALPDPIDRRDLLWTVLPE
jgi:vacuolar-type H+-ATPase subunit F/Vma7